MSIDYNAKKFDKPIKWINEKVSEGKDWDFILNPFKSAGGKISSFLEFQTTLENWEITEDEWLKLVQIEVEDSKKRKEIDEVIDKTTIISHGEDNGLTASERATSGWPKYRKILQGNGFDSATIDNIKQDAERVLQKLDLQNHGGEAIKGLVVGSVQSGKTTNMGALMSMSADSGWNVFIVLSGMIENLRKQTENRLYKELSQTNGSLNWELIERPANNGTTQRMPQLLNFDSSQYMIVTLKNATNLRNLTEWLHSDLKKSRQMKILIIDDESDQASVNTTDLEGNAERASINKILVDLVNGPDNKTNFGAMNYVGYTATPYANVLSESSLESLYPKDFIALLSQSKNYLGPNQIFGVSGEDNYPGMRIINNLDIKYRDENEAMKKLQEGKSDTLPDGLKESIAYFIASAASLRLHSHGKPVSMLVHNTVKTDSHSNVGNAIDHWLSSSHEEILKLCEKVWNQQKSQFDYSTFEESVKRYEYDTSNSKVPHNFEEIELEIRAILNKISPISLDKNNKGIYHQGIHISIDNSSQNKLTEDNKYYRLMYPSFDDKESNSITPIFIVVGGATLSRGLTLEGLTTTYFSRTSGQADSLMQMGRWFGYRVGYEVYPRIWMSNYSLKQFQYLSELDFSLREEIKNHNALGRTPKDVGVRIKTSPKSTGLKITNPNKSRGAITSDYDFTGANLQTTIFDNISGAISSNQTLMSDFIDSLGPPIIRNTNGNNSVLWEDIEFENIIPMLENYKFNSRFRMGNNIDSFIQWIEKNTQDQKLKNWNIMVIGKGVINGPSNDWHQKHFSWDMVTRSKIIDDTTDDLRIQSLRAPSDLYQDIDRSNISSPELLNKIKSNSSKYYLEIREELKLEMTPQLMIYKINKDSPAREGANLRENLNAIDNLFGIYISIPGGVKNKDYITHLTIKIDRDLKDSFLEDEMEN